MAKYKKIEPREPQHVTMTFFEAKDLKRSISAAMRSLKHVFEANPGDPDVRYVKRLLDEAQEKLGNLTDLEHIAKSGNQRSGNSLACVRVSPWIQIVGDGMDHCAMRVIEGTDPRVTENRVAFIEKSPRISLNAFWVYGPKGDDGFDPGSRAWCDDMLKAAGAELPDLDPSLTLVVDVKGKIVENPFEAAKPGL